MNCKGFVLILKVALESGESAYFIGRNKSSTLLAVHVAFFIFRRVTL